MNNEENLNLITYEKIAAQIEAHEKFAEALTKVLEILNRLQVLIKENHGDEKEQFFHLTSELNDINTELSVYREVSNKILADMFDTVKQILQKQDKTEGLLHVSASKLDSNVSIMTKVEEKMDRVLHLSQNNERLLEDYTDSSDKYHASLFQEIEENQKKIYEEIATLKPMITHITAINDKLPHFTKVFKNIAIWGGGILFLILVLEGLSQFGVLKMSFFGH